MVGFVSALAASVVYAALWILAVPIVVAANLLRRSYLKRRLSDPQDPYIDDSAAAWAAFAMIAYFAALLVFERYFPGAARWISSGGS